MIEPMMAGSIGVVTAKKKEKQKGMKILQIFSGGMDSTALLYDFINQGHEVETIWFDYGQKHKKEQLYAKEICNTLKVKLSEVNLEQINKFLTNSSLSGDKEVPDVHYEDEQAISTIVPNRNMMMLSIAVAKAINDKFDAVAFGCHYGDRVVYPDCRIEYTSALQTAIYLADRHLVKLLTPFIDITKADIVTIGEKNKVPWTKTWTCYKGLEKHCGKCPTCIERREAFHLAKVQDPTEYNINAPTTEELINRQWRP
jgi:7-cyano-7-deazaguanine synthase